MTEQATADPTGTDQETKASPGEIGEQEVAEIPAEGAAEAIEGETGGETEPTATGPTEWDAAKWTSFGQSVVSALSYGKSKPALPDGVKAEDAPADLRPLLETLGYVAKAEGEKPGEAAREAAPSDDGLRQARVMRILADNEPAYQDALQDALAEADTVEERKAARKQVEAAQAHAIIRRGLDLLVATGHSNVVKASGQGDVDQLEKIPGLLIPAEGMEDSRTAAADFLESVQTYVRSRPRDGVSEAALEAERAKHREEIAELKRQHAEALAAAGIASSGTVATSVGMSREAMLLKKYREGTGTEAEDAEARRIIRERRGRK